VGTSAPARRSADAREPASDSVRAAADANASRSDAAARFARSARLRASAAFASAAETRASAFATRRGAARRAHATNAALNARRALFRAPRAASVSANLRARADASQAPNARLNKVRSARFEARFATCHARTSCAPRAACHRPRARATATRSRRRSRAAARHAPRMIIFRLRTRLPANRYTRVLVARATSSAACASASDSRDVSWRHAAKGIAKCLLRSFRAYKIEARRRAVARRSDSDAHASKVSPTRRRFLRAANVAFARAARRLSAPRALVSANHARVTRLANRRMAASATRSPATRARRRDSTAPAKRLKANRFRITRFHFGTSSRSTRRSRDAALTHRRNAAMARLARRSSSFVVPRASERYFSTSSCRASIAHDASASARARARRGETSPRARRARGAPPSPGARAIPAPRTRGAEAPRRARGRAKREARRNRDRVRRRRRRATPSLDLSRLVSPSLERRLSAGSPAERLPEAGATRAGWACVRARHRRCPRSGAWRRRARATPRLAPPREDARAWHPAARRARRWRRPWRARAPATRASSGRTPGARAATRQGPPRASPRASRASRASAYPPSAATTTRLAMRLCHPTFPRTRSSARVLRGSEAASPPPNSGDRAGETLEGTASPPVRVACFRRVAV